MAFATIFPSNIGISKLIYNLKGEAPPLEVDVSLVGSRRRICAKLSIISFLCRSRDSSSNILKGSRVLSYLFLPAMDNFLGMQEQLTSR
jgi:hypothetical protein